MVGELDPDYRNRLLFLGWVHRLFHHPPRHVSSELRRSLRSSLAASALSLALFAPVLLHGDQCDSSGFCSL